MITESTIRYHTNRTYALKELLDTTFKLAHEHAIEGTDTPYDVVERIRDLLFCAHEVASGLATDLDGLIAQAQLETTATPAAPPQTPSHLCDLWSLGMTTFATNVLRSNGISSISQLTSMTKLDLIRLPRAGKKTVPHIQDRLAANGLSLVTRGAL